MTDEPPEDSGGSDLRVYVGGSCHCEAVSVEGLPALLFTALLLAARLFNRRARGLVALCAALMTLQSADAADVQLLQLSDGGPFTTFRADPGEPWQIGAVGGASYAHMPAMIYSGGRRAPLMPRLVTAELAAGLTVGSRVRLSFAAPTHWLFGPDPSERFAPGDLSVSFSASPSPLDALHRSLWGVRAVLPTGVPEQMLGSTLATVFSFAHQRPIGSFIAGFSGALRLQQEEELPGIVLGSRIEARLGLVSIRRLGLGLEGFGSVPVRATYTEVATVPFELLATSRRQIAPALYTRLGAGVGLGMGIGSPTFRLLATIEGSAVPVDSDGDGITNPRDLCDERPEDRDKHADWDGCPDVDNDKDGLLDPDDGCPDDPETFNEIADADGCPDEAARLRLALSSPDPAFEGGSVEIAGRRVEILAGEEVELELIPEALSARATATGHQPKIVDLDLSAGGTFEATIPLAPITWGDLVIFLEDSEKRPLAGAVSSGGQRWDVPPEGLPLTLWSGKIALTASAEGYGPRIVDVLVPINAERAVHIELQALTLWADGPEVRLRDEIRFELDSAELTPSSALPIAALARWLSENPSVELVRIEGHADEPGSPRYNYALSTRRAEAVRDALTALGVDEARLVTSGSGEAQVPRGDEGERRVTFLVVVWDDSELSLPDEIAPLFGP